MAKNTTVSKKKHVENLVDLLAKDYDERKESDGTTQEEIVREMGFVGSITSGIQKVSDWINNRHLPTGESVRILEAYLKMRKKL